MQVPCAPTVVKDAFAYVFRNDNSPFPVSGSVTVIVLFDTLSASDPLAWPVNVPVQLPLN